MLVDSLEMGYTIWVPRKIRQLIQICKKQGL
jgi:hypothetical protein